MTKEERMEYQREYRQNMTDRQKEMYRETKRLYARRRRKSWRERGLCLICGSTRDDDAYSTCSRCREYQRERARRMKYKGSVWDDL